MSPAGHVPRPDADSGGRMDLDALFNLTYGELRRLASSVKRGDQSITINPTALVHEAWLKLSRSPELRTTSLLHFKRIAARAMRQVLVEAARRRMSGKRSGAEGTMFVTFDEATDRAVSREDDLIALDDALEALAHIQPRQALLVESRFFGGLDIGETATLLNVSEATILRDWRAARAWLGTQLRESR